MSCSQGEVCGVQTIVQFVARTIRKDRKLRLCYRTYMTIIIRNEKFEESKLYGLLNLPANHKRTKIAIKM